MQYLNCIDNGVRYCRCCGFCMLRTSMTSVEENLSIPISKLRPFTRGVGRLLWYFCIFCNGQSEINQRPGLGPSLTSSFLRNPKYIFVWQPGLGTSSATLWVLPAARCLHQGTWEIFVSLQLTESRVKMTDVSICVHNDMIQYDTIWYHSDNDNNDHDNDNRTDNDNEMIWHDMWCMIFHTMIWYVTYYICYA